MRYDKFYFHALKTSVDYFINVGKIGDSPVVKCNILMWILIFGENATINFL